MENKKYCQSCGMDLNDSKNLEINDDGTLNNEFCIHCYKDGKYTSVCTLDEMVESNLKYLDEWNKENNSNFTMDEARVELRKFLSNLKRWKCTCTMECDTGYNPKCTCTSSECHCRNKN